MGRRPRDRQVCERPQPLSRREIDIIAAWADARRARRQPRRPAARAEIHRRLVDRQARSRLQDAAAVQRCRPTARCPTSYVTIPTNLKEDIWIRGVELKPTDRRVVHHIISDLVEGDGKPVDPAPKLTRDRSPQGSRRRARRPRARPLVRRLYEEGVARKIPAGADIVLQMHYTTIGEPVTDQTEIGVVLAKEPPTKLRAGGGGQIPNTDVCHSGRRIRITRSAQSRPSNRDTYLMHDVSAHARARQGRAVHDRLSRRTRRSRAATCRSNDFNWQLNYRLAEPKFMPKGSTLDRQGALRQLEGQPVQSRSDRHRAVGRSDVGRDVDRVLTAPSKSPARKSRFFFFF